jgi:hypothetical protein
MENRESRRIELRAYARQPRCRIGDEERWRRHRAGEVFEMAGGEPRSAHTSGGGPIVLSLETLEELPDALVCEGRSRGPLADSG